ncbi:MAG: DUF3631 domain-containing protein [Nitrospirae bacterium]|nr:DUF3631 domain-containing protein [Candidatus Manganitrophaceae bacterium]
MEMTTLKLRPEHIEDLRQSGLSEETIEAAGIRSVEAEEAKRILNGIDCGPGWGVDWPTHGNPNLAPLTTVKPDKPYRFPDGRTAKYLMPKGARNRLYIPPMLKPEDLTRRILDIYITEGVKKALSGVQADLVCLGLNGVDSFTYRDDYGLSHPIEDLSMIEWNGRSERRVFIVFDSDQAIKPHVRKAQYRLAVELRKRGAEVSAILLPSGPNGEKVGLDDYLLRHNFSDLQSLPRDPLDAPPIFTVEEWLKAYEDGDDKANVREILQALAGLSLLDYEQIRERVAKIGGVRVSVLDAEVAALRPEGETSQTGTPMEFEEIIPWDEPVDGAALFDEIETTLKTFMIIPDHAAMAIPLWVAFSHSIDLFRVAPILSIVSPEMRCGKTTLLSIIAQLVPKPLTSSNISGPALFRSIEKWSPTLIVDEADSFLKGNEELRGIFNSGHTRTTAFVIRTVGDDHEPRRFNTWGAKVVALIGKLPATMTDRSIVISLQRKKPGEKVERLKGEHSRLFLTLGRKLFRWVKDNERKLKETNPETPESLNDRARDNWQPLFAIAEVAGGAWPEKVRRAAEKLSSDPGEGGLGVKLLSDIREVISERHKNEEKIFSSVLLEEILKLEERPWPDAFGGKGLTPARMAKLLNDFGIKSRDVRIREGVKKGFLKEDFDEAFARYLPEGGFPPFQSATEIQTNTGAGFSVFQSATEKNGVALEKMRIANSDTGCSGVAFRKGEKGGVSLNEGENPDKEEVIEL